MISDEFLEMLRCPECRAPLRLAEPGLVDKLNAEIRAGRLANRGGQTLTRPIDAALVRDDGQVAYPVFDDMPVLLVDEGILVSA